MMTEGQPEMKNQLYSMYKDVQLLTNEMNSTSKILKVLKEKIEMKLELNLTSLPMDILGKIARYTIDNEIINGYGETCQKLFSITGVFSGRKFVLKEEISQLNRVDKTKNPSRVNDETDFKAELPGFVKCKE